MKHKDINSADKESRRNLKYSTNIHETCCQLNIPAFKHEPHNICDGRMTPVEASKALQSENHGQAHLYCIIDYKSSNDDKNSEVGISKHGCCEK
jgi:hypothetical protein